MVVDKVNDIISSIIESTKIGSMIWEEYSYKSNPIYNNEKSFHSTSSDGLTKFEIDIKYIYQKDKWIVESACTLLIKNDKLPDNRFIAGSYTYPQIFEIRNLLHDKFCRDLNPGNSIVEEVLVDICKNVSPSIYRDNKINNIMNEG